MNKSQSDRIDVFRAAWKRETPDIDTEPMSILGRIHRVANMVRPSIEGTFAHFALDRGEFDVLATLRRSQPPYRLTPTELYRSLMISSGGLTNRLVRLEAAGLVRREKSKVDGRSLVVVLTAAGARRAEDAFRADMASEAQWLDGLSVSDRKALSGLLRKLLVDIETRATGSDTDNESVSA